MTFVAKFISWLFLPLFMPIYALLLLLYTPSNQDFIYFNHDNLFSLNPSFKLSLIFVYVLFCVVMPGLTLLMMKSWGMISDIEIGNRSERQLPILVTAIYCLVLYILLVMKIGDLHDDVPRFIFSLALSGIAVSIVYYFANMWKKISIHAGGGGIFVGFVLAYFLSHREYEFWILPLGVVVSGIIMSARLYLEKHKLSEVIFGWFIACFVTFIVNYYY